MSYGQGPKPTRLTQLSPNKWGGLVGSVQDEYFYKFMLEVVLPAFGADQKVVDYFARRKPTGAIVFGTRIWEEGQKPVLSAKAGERYEGRKATTVSPPAVPVNPYGVSTPAPVANPYAQPGPSPYSPPPVVPAPVVPPSVPHGYAPTVTAQKPGNPGPAAPAPDDEIPF